MKHETVHTGSTVFGFSLSEGFVVLKTCALSDLEPVTLLAPRFCPNAAIFVIVFIRIDSIQTDVSVYIFHEFTCFIKHMSC